MTPCGPFGKQATVHCGWWPVCCGFRMAFRLSHHERILIMTAILDRASVREQWQTELARQADIRLSVWADRLEYEGGFTVCPRTAHYVTSGYAVSTHPECERVIQGRVTPADLKEYGWDHRSTLTLDGNVFGAWRDDETGLTYLDVSTVVHDRVRALRLARVHNQLAVFDLARGIEIRA